MTPGPDPADEADAPRESDWERKRRLAEVFGEVLPTTTRDEREPGGSTGATSGGRADPGEEWLRAQVPPHHGG